MPFDVRGSKMQCRLLWGSRAQLDVDVVWTRLRPCWRCSPSTHPITQSIPTKTHTQITNQRIGHVVAAVSCEWFGVAAKSIQNPKTSTITSRRSPRMRTCARRPSHNHLSSPIGFDLV